MRAINRNTLTEYFVRDPQLGGAQGPGNDVPAGFLRQRAGQGRTFIIMEASDADGFVDEREAKVLAGRWEELAPAGGALDGEPQLPDLVDQLESRGVEVPPIVRELAADNRLGGPEDLWKLGMWLVTRFAAIGT